MRHLPSPTTCATQLILLRPSLARRLHAKNRDLGLDKTVSWSRLSRLRSTSLDTTALIICLLRIVLELNRRSLSGLKITTSPLMVCSHAILLCTNFTRTRNMSTNTTSSPQRKSGCLDLRLHIVRGASSSRKRLAKWVSTKK